MSAIVFALVLAAGLGTASAKVPTFSYVPPSIVPGDSIGGVEVGMTRNRAKVEWGAPSRCDTSGGLTTCSYDQRSSSGPHRVAAFYVRNGRVVAISVEDPLTAMARRKVRRLKTNRGIHVGSLMSEARQKYGIPPPGPGEANRSRAGFRRGRRCTMFYAPQEPYRVIDSITVGICRSVIMLYF